MLDLDDVGRAVGAEQRKWHQRMEAIVHALCVLCADGGAVVMDENGWWHEKAWGGQRVRCGAKVVHAQRWMWGGD